MPNKTRRNGKGPIVSIPTARATRSTSNSPITPKTPKTPKTPADEGLEFFQSAVGANEAPLHVYELKLDVDGGPSKDRSVRPQRSARRVASAHE